MPERLDDLLRELPIDSMPAGLPGRIQRRLTSARAGESRARLLVDVGLASALLAGTLTLRPFLKVIPGLVSVDGLAGATSWVGQLGSAPAPTIWSTLTGALDWALGLTDNLGVAGLLGLMLLALPLFAWLPRLLPAREEGVIA